MASPRGGLGFLKVYFLISRTPLKNLGGGGVGLIRSISIFTLSKNHLYEKCYLRKLLVQKFQIDKRFSKSLKGLAENICFCTPVFSSWLGGSKEKLSNSLSGYSSVVGEGPFCYQIEACFSNRLYYPPLATVNLGKKAFIVKSKFVLVKICQWCVHTSYRYF